MANLAEHKKAWLNYEILDKFEAGLALTGQEVKSIRAGRARLEGAHVIVRGGEAYLVNASIPAYQIAGVSPSYNAEAPRKLLLNRKELDVLTGKEHTHGLTIVPLALYSKGRLLKLSIALAKGKKKHDKRESLKKREHERDIAREMKFR